MSQPLPPAYQSPISVSRKQSIKISQCLSIVGKNKGAVFNTQDKVYNIVDDVIILEIGSRRYQLDEYHFHTPGEHTIDGKTFKSEIHFVFVELTNDLKCLPKDRVRSNICNGVIPNGNILAIGRVIKDNEKHIDLSKLQVELPSRYFEYDGSLTTGTYSPVRWILGEKSIKLNLEDIAPKAKTARPIQSLDGRIILYVDSI